MFLNPVRCFVLPYTIYSSTPLPASVFSLCVVTVFGLREIFYHFTFYDLFVLFVTLRNSQERPSNLLPAASGHPLSVLTGTDSKGCIRDFGRES